MQRLFPDTLQDQEVDSTSLACLFLLKRMNPLLMEADLLLESSRHIRDSLGRPADHIPEGGHATPPRDCVLRRDSRKGLPPFPIASRIRSGMGIRPGQSRHQNFYNKENGTGI